MIAKTSQLLYIYIKKNEVTFIDFSCIGIIQARRDLNGKRLLGYLFYVTLYINFRELLSGSIRNNAKPDMVISMVSEIKYFEVTALPDSMQLSSALSRLAIHHTSLMSTHDKTNNSSFVSKL